MTGSRPVLSIVATSRNDDHGLDMRKRMQLFVDGIFDQARRFEAQVELILVEWNPPAERPPLAEAITWPAAGTVTSRVITVGPEIHRRYSCAGGLPLLQMIAKNVGIRRAEGEFVLATNVDVLFGDELFRHITGGLQNDTVFRADRIDVDRAVLAEDRPKPAAVRLAQPVRTQLKQGIYVVSGSGPEAHWRQVAYGYVQRVRRNAERVRTLTFRERIGFEWRALRRFVELPRLHTYACGDFTLISRAGWFGLRGYAEWEMYSMHIDSLLMYQAAANGLEFVNLPASMPVIHVDHELGSGWSPEGEELLFDRLRRAGVLFLGDQELSLLATSLWAARKRHRPLYFNLDGWGLGREDLPEVHVTP